MRFEGLVSADNIGAVQAGQAVSFRVNGYPDQEFTGKVRRVNPAANATTRQVEVLVDFTGEKQPRLAGLYAEGHVETASRHEPHPAGHGARARRRQGLGLAREGRQAAEGDARAGRARPAHAATSSSRAGSRRATR